MRIATFNINGINGRLSHLIDWLAETTPDIVCLQELKAPQDKFPRSALERAGYGAAWAGQARWNGVAILARDVEPVETRRALPGDDADTQGRYLEAAVRGVLIGCVYLPNGNPQPGPKFDYKLAWAARLRTHAASLLAERHPVILMGDFNVIPTDLDVYNPASWKDDSLMHPQAQKAFAALLSDGWTDAVRHLHPQERIYTFWKYWRNAWARDAGLRIDHALLSPDLARRLVACGVDRDARGRDGASDHAPMWIELAPSPPGKAAGRKSARVTKKPVASSRVAARRKAAARRSTPAATSRRRPQPS
ncbi:MAG: xth [Hyphomicrobiales bacterium]|nr:xth [Hyphomicrobiales bacterium]